MLTAITIKPKITATFDRSLILGKQPYWSFYVLYYNNEIDTVSNLGLQAFGLKNPTLLPKYKCDSSVLVFRQ